MHACLVFMNIKIAELSGQRNIVEISKLGNRKKHKDTHKYHFFHTQQFSFEAELLLNLEYSLFLFQGELCP